MIRIELGPEGLGRARLAVSPLMVAANLLHALVYDPRSVEVAWRARAREALREHGLELLAVLGGGGPYGYAPDFVRPVPLTFDPTLDAELHQVATTPAERVRYEVTGALGGRSWDPLRVDPGARLLQETLRQGEDRLARRAADQLDKFWREVLARQWPRLEADLYGDVEARGTTLARHGAIGTFDRLGPSLYWRDGGLELPFISPTRERKIDADTVVFVPSPFTRRVSICADEFGEAPAPRVPVIIYPASIGASASLTGELIGDTRSRILAELGRPSTTGEVARRLHLSPSTVSYHLQILHRAGLLQRTRHSLEVRYQRR
ncbi:ArsR/SmtB family transcription factor [Nonomuraea sediminis]|uniref:ArsR/SmtB family transcription factor n=1 Tax=Nonomuraea sediminis TaxID=2835864 RepID=UPI001BDCD10E|nr:winged helix-turn-helix domain-containing protein [Nonomuraea sediminis]